MTSMCRNLSGRNTLADIMTSSESAYCENPFLATPAVLFALKGNVNVKFVAVKFRGIHRAYYSLVGF